MMQLKGQCTQNETSVIIYSSSSRSKPVWMCLFCWTQRKIFWRMRETEYFFSYYGSQWCPKTAWLQTFFKISSFVFRTNTFIQVWNYLRESKWWQKFHFWWWTVSLRSLHTESEIFMRFFITLSYQNACYGCENAAENRISSQFFYDGWRFQRQCGNVIDTNVRSYCLTCKNFRWEFRTRCAKTFIESRRMGSVWYGRRQWRCAPVAGPFEADPADPVVDRSPFRNGDDTPPAHLDRLHICLWSTS